MSFINLIWNDHALWWLQLVQRKFLCTARFVKLVIGLCLFLSSWKSLIGLLIDHDAWCNVWLRSLTNFLIGISIETPFQCGENVALGKMPWFASKCGPERPWLARLSASSLPSIPEWALTLTYTTCSDLKLVTNSMLLSKLRLFAESHLLCAEYERDLWMLSMAAWLSV